ncbi:MAG: hypothetical protein KIT58_20915 [Planctomycetota bacterium]|nr:hypothetical protein [Planctomycetota bacterium]
MLPVDRRALALLAEADAGPLPPPTTDAEAHLRAALAWLDLLDVTADGGHELTRRGRRRVEALAAFVLEDLGHALRQTTSRVDGGPAGGGE